MAKKIENEKGFKVLEVPRSELRDATGGPGVCDHCLATPKVGYYIAVLNHWVCPSCYERWSKDATFYREDVGVENKHYDSMVSRLESCR